MLWSMFIKIICHFFSAYHTVKKQSKNIINDTEDDFLSLNK
jgi:hypothetical protein